MDQHLFSEALRLPRTDPQQTKEPASENHRKHLQRSQLHLARSACIPGSLLLWLSTAPSFLESHGQKNLEAETPSHLSVSRTGLVESEALAGKPKR